MNFDLLSSEVKPAPHIKVLVNIGAGFDIPNGIYLQGKYGESILNGGFAPLTGFVGIGNNFKSTAMHFAVLTLIARITGSRGEGYDTETNMHESRIQHLADHIHELNGEKIFITGRWKITDKTMHSGNEWYKLFRAFMESKIKNQDKLSVTLPFLNREGTDLMTMICPTAAELDSLSEFETDDVTEMQIKNELGESGGNMIHQRQGLAKTRLLMELPRFTVASATYMGITAHLGKESTLQNAGPAGHVPISKLATLKNGDKIKGTTDKFTFVMHDCYNCHGARAMINQTTKAPEYPRGPEDDLAMDTDLMLVKLTNLRSKSGKSGMTQMLVVSQRDGVLPALTEFHLIKEMDRFGLEGNDRSYSLAIYPDCKLQRTTVRSKIDEDARLRRALNITSELCQITNLWQGYKEGFICTPKQLYDDLKAKGYDWDVLLDTRGWWTYDNDKHAIPFLSTMDLLRMRAGEYHPYWMKPL